MTSLPQLVTALITAIGSGTVDDILADCEGYTRVQVIRAMQNAARRGFLKCDGPSKQQGTKGSYPGTYRPGDRPPLAAKAKPKPQEYRRPAASVWQYAQLSA